jgi:hypothetical protein
MRIEGGYTNAKLQAAGALTDPVKSTGWLNFSAVPIVGEIVTLDSEVYTFSDDNEAWQQSRISNSTKFTNVVHIGSTPVEAIKNLHACIHRNNLVTNNIFVTLSAGASNILQFTHRKCGDNNTYVTTTTVTGATQNAVNLENGVNLGAGRFPPCRAFIPAGTGNFTVYIPKVEDLGEPSYDGNGLSRCPSGDEVLMGGLQAGTVYPLVIAGLKTGAPSNITALY